MDYQEFITTFYFVCGIIFSITVGLMLNTSFTAIRNRGFREKYRKQNKNLLNKLLTMFALTTIAFIFGKIVVNFEILAAIVIGFEFCYLVWTLKFLHKFNGDIADCILTETMDAERQKEYDGCMKN